MKPTTTTLPPNPRAPQRAPAGVFEQRPAGVERGIAGLVTLVALYFAARVLSSALGLW